MRIDKVNVNPTAGTTLIEYSTIENDGKDVLNHRLKSSDDPHPKLVKALGALKSTVQDLAELPEDYLDDVRGLTLHRDDEDPEMLSVTFTATKRLDGCNAPLVVNTPQMVPSEKARRLVDAVLGYATDFVRGKRAQGELPMRDGKAAAAGEREEPEEEAPEAPAEPAPAPKAKGKKGAKAKPGKVPEAYRNSPEDDDGQVYECKAPNGDLCRVKQDGAGAWWGRIGGKPIAQAVKTSKEARELVDEHLSGMGAWKPTVDFGQDDAAAEAPAGAEAPAEL